MCIYDHQRKGGFLIPPVGIPTRRWPRYTSLELDNPRTCPSDFNGPCPIEQSPWISTALMAIIYSPEKVGDLVQQGRQCCWVKPLKGKVSARLPKVRDRHSTAADIPTSTIYYHRLFHTQIQSFTVVFRLFEFLIY